MLHLGRVPRWTPWTQAFRRAAGRAVAEEAIVAEEAPVAVEPGLGTVTIETPKGKDNPGDLGELNVKRFGPDLARGEHAEVFPGLAGGINSRTSCPGRGVK